MLILNLLFSFSSSPSSFAICGHTYGHKSFFLSFSLSYLLSKRVFVPLWVSSSNFTLHFSSCVCPFGTLCLFFYLFSSLTGYETTLLNHVLTNNITTKTTTTPPLRQNYKHFHLFLSHSSLFNCAFC